MFSDFCKQIDNRYYKHIHTKSNIPISRIPDRQKFLDNLKAKIITKQYHPQTPRAYVVNGKEHLISRIIPILKVEDSCIYYYCVKKIENYLAKTRIDGTFGGFSMGGIIREMEESDFAEISGQESSSSYPYNPIAWSKEWGDFQKKAYAYAERDDYSYFMKFDIANFYDSVNLNYLEAKI